MNCLDSRRTVRVGIYLIYILLRLKGQHTDKMAQNIQTVSMEIKDETSEISEAAIQYNTQSLGYYMNQQ